MREWVRRQIDQLCNHAQDTFTGVVVGGQPTDEFFGATGDPGTSTSAAASDHLHGMPDIQDILNDDAFFFDDAILTTPQNVFVIHVGNAAGGAVTITARDDIGAFGAFGSFDFATGSAATASAGVMIANAAVANNSSTLQIHLWQRTKEIVIRCAPGITVATDLNQVLVAVGAMRSTVNFGNTAATVANITDGVYFLLTTDATGAGNWFATTMNNGATTSVDTKVAAVTDGTNVGFQSFKISYDHPTTTATFFIDDVQVASISTNIPPSTRKVAGWGIWRQNLAPPGARVTSGIFDRLLFLGDRVAQT